MTPQPLLKQKIQIGFNPIKRFTNLSCSNLPFDKQTIKLNNAVPAVFKFDVNMWRRMVVKVHYHPRFRETL